MISDGKRETGSDNQKLIKATVHKYKSKMSFLLPSSNSAVTVFNAANSLLYFENSIEKTLSRILSRILVYAFSAIPE